MELRHQNQTNFHQIQMFFLHLLIVENGSMGVAFQEYFNVSSLVQFNGLLYLKILLLGRTEAVFVARSG